MLVLCRYSEDDNGGRLALITGFTLYMVYIILEIWPLAMHILQLATFAPSLGFPSLPGQSIIIA